MKRGIAVLLSLTALLVVAYFTASKWAIRHDIVTLHDADPRQPSGRSSRSPFVATS